MCTTIQLELFCTAVKTGKEGPCWNTFILLYIFHSGRLSDSFLKGCWGCCFSETQPRGNPLLLTPTLPPALQAVCAHSAVPTTQDCYLSESCLGCNTACPSSPGIPYSIVRDFLGLSPPPLTVSIATLALVLLLSRRLFLLITIVACCHQHHFVCQLVIS